MNSNQVAENGFTLVELLVVIAIISLLGTLMITTFTGAQRDAEEFEAEAFIKSIEATLDVYRSDRRNGVFPPSTLEGFPALGSKLPNKTNLGIEALVVCLSAPGFDGLGNDSEAFEGALTNTDEDFSSRRMTKFGAKDLFELQDPWGNPYAYFRAQDYGNRNLQAYCLGDGEIVTVKPWVNPKTKSPYNQNGFQLFSAGRDGEYNTEDDIGNWREQ